jgi:hypothetical protein
MDCVPGIGGTTTSVRLASDVRVLVLVPEVEAEVVDYVSGIFYNVGAFGEVSSSCFAAEVFESCHVIDVRGGREARQDAFLCKEECTGADRKDGSLASGILLLKLCEIGDETERLELLLDDLGRVATEDDEDIKLLKALVSLLERDLTADHDALLGEHLGLGASESNLKGFGG